jgi:hypothetical protein
VDEPGRECGEGRRGLGRRSLCRGAKNSPGEPDRYEVAMAWHLRFDTEVDATEAAEIIEARFGKGCSPRPDLGPIAWRARGTAIAIAAGPFERRGNVAKSAGACAIASKWVEATLKGERR